MKKPRNQALTYKGYHNVQNPESSICPHLRASFTKLNDTNINYNLRNVETYLTLPKPTTNFLKSSFKCSAAML